jgi:hypothetical protein
MLDDDLTGLADDLRALGRTIDVAPRPDLAGRVMAALDPPPRRHGVPAARRFAVAARRPVAAIVTFLLVAAAAVALASPPVRAAIRHLFAGVEIRHEPAPTLPASPALPGEHPTDLTGAARAVGFAVLVPSSLGRPDLVTVADGRVVSLVWHRPGGDVRLDEFAGDLGVMFEKYSLGAAESTTVNGGPALWFGAGTTIEYVGADGRTYPESTRPTGRTLVWTAGRITLRLDGLPTEADAVAVAAGVPR